MAASIFFIEAFIVGIASPGILQLGFVQWLGISILKCSFSTAAFPVFTRNEKYQAYHILCEYCLSEESCKDIHDLTSENLIDEEICKIFRVYRRNIRLSILLDNIGPSRLSDLLLKLNSVMNENNPREGTVGTEMIPTGTGTQAVQDDVNEAVHHANEAVQVYFHKADQEELVSEAVQVYVNKADLEELVSEAVQTDVTDSAVQEHHVLLADSV